MEENQLVPAQKSDLKEIFELEQLCFDAEAFTRRQLRYLLSQAKGYFLLRRQESRISAFMILLKKKNSSGMRLYSIAVNPRFRGQGLGRIMLAEALKRAAADGFKYLTLEVSEENKPAVTLYLQQGFEVFGERRAYYKNGSTALLMRKAVGKSPEPLPNGL
ncbi:GNAT family N-acetyltransferase [Mangrovibacterium marinum]|uniref:Ribosomal-protein-alanine N-acetyltransferase n=1 Tax=Mangrovibacterium marinum TaxID=1639118 RepID=A0A2T5C191_9BACT|nr:GNAT family N-acetyltransferase [Mangrovibacterium marinum]PTN08355.1 ribosomal-protein-alanine N-acetyltransferase [Mangrovibacterium marinum]